MIYMLLAAVFAMFSFQFFILNFSIQGLNRAVVYTPIELLTIDVTNRSDEVLFNVDDIEEHVLSYYENTLPRYTKNYEVSFYFYNADDNSMCLSKYCDAVEITVDADLILSYKYHRVMYYMLVG